MTEPLDALVAVIVCLFLNAVIISRVRSKLPSDEGRFLAKTYGLTLLLRLSVAVLLNIFVTNLQFASYFWGDSTTYDSLGYYLARSWSEDLAVNPRLQSAVTGYGFVYLIGSLYYVFGRNQLLVQFTNSTIGALSVVMIYLIARKLFDAKVARWAALFMAFFPQTIFWSCAMYKDPLILLCIAVAMFAVLSLRERLTAGSLFLFVAAMLVLMTLRFYVFYMVAFATLGTYVISQRRGLLSGLFGQFVLAGVFLVALFFGVREATFERQASLLSLEQIQRARLGQLAQGRSDFGAGIDISTPQGALRALPVGLAYLLFAPFPWAISGIRQVLTLPEMLVWYALMPALVRGLRYTVRHRFRAALPILTFAAILTLAYAVFQSNVGTAYRQRTQITMFFFIFMGVGIETKRRSKEPNQLLGGPSTSSGQP